ncbi:MAG: cytochrome P460 family protein [Nitrospirota bacterium]
MKHLALLFLTAVAMFGIISIAYAVHGIVPAETPAVMPGPDAKALGDFITKTNPYTQWNMWPGKQAFYKGTEPHGALLTTYVNDVAYNSIRSKKGMADGSVIVKENYTPDKQLAAVTVMYRIKGYHPAGGDWFWAKYRPDGSVEASGKLEGCIKCHGQRAANDYIMTEDIMK